MWTNTNSVFSEILHFRLIYDFRGVWELLCYLFPCSYSQLDYFGYKLVNR